MPKVINHSMTPTSRRRRLLPSFLGPLLLSTSSAFEPATTSHDKTIIAYYASWQWYDRSNLAKPSNLDMSKVSRYNFAFFQPTPTGEIYGTDSWADAIVLFGEFDWSAVPGEGVEYCSWDAADEPPTCAGHQYETGLIHLAHQAGVEVYPSIGGWTLSDNFPTLAASPDARAKFAQQCVDLIKNYDFDGIDIDWEYPGFADHSGTSADTENYSLFLQAIRDALDTLGDETGRTYGLTAALPCGPDLISNIQIDVVAGILSELNLMTYDFHGTWDPNTGINAPLYDPNDADLSVDGCVNNWIAAGGTNDQINIGLPFYGRSYAGSGITGKDQPYAGSADTSTWADDEGSPQYFNIMNKISELTSVRDDETMTQIAYNADGYLSYDDERAICDKTEYAMENNLNGFIIWEISGDVMDDLSTPLLDAANQRLNNPDTSCDGSAAPATNNTVVNTTKPTSISKHSGKWFPESGVCTLSTGTIPAWLNADSLTDSQAECCQMHYPNTNSCTVDDPSDSAPTVITPMPTSQPLGNTIPGGNTLESTSAPPVINTIPGGDTVDTTSTPTLKPTPQPVDYVVPSGPQYYPDYGSDGSNVECISGGDVPAWLTQNMLKSNNFECCRTYFPSQADECGAASDSDDDPYYPNFDTFTCESDKNPPSWMAGDYLHKNKWLCCQSFFSHDSDLLLGCQQG